MNLKRSLLTAALFASLGLYAQKTPELAVNFVSARHQDQWEATSQGAVKDMEHLFSREQKRQLQTSLAGFEKATGNQIILISAGSMEDFPDFDQYALHLIDQMQVKRQIDDSGIVLVFSSALRKIHLNTEFDTEKKISDTRYGQIVQEVIIPEFRAGNHYAGVQKGVEELLAAYQEN